MGSWGKLTPEVPLQFPGSQAEWSLLSPAIAYCIYNLDEGTYGLCKVSGTS